ncbi:MAG: nucleotide sugar dehydrogenase [Alphaproteobacteria bacterium]|nr:nucleotide sugar dehydrogenase [Alphaproteobacteria bacterium]
MLRIGYAGMSHLGLCSAVAAADKGAEVIGYDADGDVIAALKAGRLPVVEPGLDDLFAKHRSSLSFISSAGDLASCDLVYIARDVPTDDAGASDLAPIDRLLGEIIPVLKRDAVLVVLCQVPPGFTRARARPGLSLFYQVETLIFGRAVERATKPERFIVGCADPAAPLPPALADFLGRFGCPILPMRFESAELCKIAINVCLVASIGVANTLADLSERIGADWSEIVPALRLDARIGPKAYIQPGLGIAGGNLERDLATVCRLADASGSDAGIIRAQIANNRRRADWVLRRLSEVLAPGDTVGILGLAYKEDTHSTKNSPSLALIAHLGPWALRVHDPVVAFPKGLHGMTRQCANALEVCDGAAALAIMTPWAEYRSLAPREITARMKSRLVIDPFAVLDRAACREAGVSQIALGRPKGAT